MIWFILYLVVGYFFTFWFRRHVEQEEKGSLLILIHLLWFAVAIYLVIDTLNKDDFWTRFYGGPKL